MFSPLVGSLAKNVAKHVLVVLTIAVSCINSATAQTLGTAYRSDGRCGLFQKAAVNTPDWACVGIVAGPAHGLVMPRAIVQVSSQRFILTDMGSWSPGKGRVLQLELNSRGEVRITTLYDGLDLPHGLALGPDGKVYVGERGSVWRFDHRTPFAPRELVVDGLPNRGLHRLKHIVFDREGDLIFNAGAPSDRCEGPGGLVRWPCLEGRGRLPLGALWRLRFGAAQKSHNIAPLALGLRNSVALAVHPISGLLLQAENSADYPNDDFPPDELNIIEAGKHYGWPYCVGDDIALPEYQRYGVECSRYVAPAALLPAHSAPLGLVYYSGDMFPELEGTLIISLHGYRKNGHRILAASIDQDGRPTTRPNARLVNAFELVSGWSQQRGIRPLGSPTGVSLASDGSIWFVEDKNRTVMSIQRSTIHDPKQPPAQVAAEQDLMAAPEGWKLLYSDVIRPKCGGCHVEFTSSKNEKAWQEALSRGWLQPSDLAASPLFDSMLGRGGRRPMPPPPNVLDQKSKKQLSYFLSSLSSPPRKTNGKTAPSKDGG